MTVTYDERPIFGRLSVEARMILGNQGFVGYGTNREEALEDLLQRMERHSAAVLRAVADARAAAARENVGGAESRWARLTR